MALVSEHETFYILSDIYSLPEGRKAELISGRIYNMALPTRTHQRLAGEPFTAIRESLSNGTCEIAIAPFAVFLSTDDSKYLEPNISVICAQDKPDEHGCDGPLTELSRLYLLEAESWTTKRSFLYTGKSGCGNIGLRIL